MTTPKQNPDGEAVVETREMDMSRDRNTPPTEWLENVVTIDARVGIYAWPSPDSNLGHTYDLALVRDRGQMVCMGHSKPHSGRQRAATP